MTTNTFGVIRIDIPARGVLIFLDTEYRILRAVDHTVIAFETQATAHATLGFLDSLLFGQTNEALLEVAQDFLGRRHFLGRGPLASLTSNSSGA